VKTGNSPTVGSRSFTRIAVLAFLVAGSFAALPAVASAACPPNTPPVASFNYSPSAPEVGQSVSFDGSGSSPGMSWFPTFFDPIAGEICTPLPSAISSYSWDWGDGSPAGSGATTSHSFAAPGTYNVTLTVTSWTTDTETKAVSVTPAPSIGGGEGSTPPPGDGGSTPPPDAGSTPPPSGGGAEFPRTLNIAYSAKKDAFAGKLASQAPSCIANQKVAVFEKKKGKDPKVGSATTSPAGTYSLKEKNPEGSFYAKVGQTSTSGGACLVAQSKAIKVG
jgi:hypothetical protein